MTKINKEEFLKQVDLHIEQDRLMQGSYGDDSPDDDFKGCFMGCVVDSISKINGDKITHDDHKEQAEYIFGDSSAEWFVRLYERIFEGLAAEDSKWWFKECSKSMIGKSYKEINQLETLIKIFIIESTKKYHDNKEVHKVIDQVKEALLSDDDQLLSAARSAASAAESAASAAESAAWSAARSAAWSAESAASAASAESAAWSAARSAARSAASAAWSAASAARSAASAAWSAASAARSASYKELAEHVIYLLEGGEK